MIKSRLSLVYHALINRGIPVHRNENIYPFFIVGSGRCGTTLLRRVIMASDGIHIPPENFSLDKLIRSFNQYRLHEDWNTIVYLAVAQLCQNTEGWFESFPNELVNRATQCPKNERSLSWLLDSLYKYQAEISNAECLLWGDKTPWNINIMDSILQVFPNAKFIHMIRDGVDVVYSYKRTGFYGDDISIPAQKWQSAINLGNRFKKKNPSKIIEIKYENLINEPNKTLENICKYLSIEFDEKMLNIYDNDTINDLKKIKHHKNALKPISAKNIGKGRKEITQNERKKLKKTINTQLLELGYESL